MNTSKSGKRIVIGNSSASKVLVLNPTGSILWDSLSSNPGGLSVVELVHVLKSSFPDQEEVQLRKDVEAFLEKVSDRQMINITESENG
ncbi:MAG: PqqD family protein [Verrucomicrobiales bacterium]|nr:PqqD family protein [Verrucomicrobiales bacterium]